MGTREPTGIFAAASLDIVDIPLGSIYGRIYRQTFSNPLGHGKNPSRFSDPRRRIADHRFGVLYLGSSMKVCFLEAVLRDDRDGVVGDHLMDEAELDTRSYAEIEIQAPLRLIDLTDDGPVRMGIPSDVIDRRNKLARRWSRPFTDIRRRSTGFSIRPA